jgi:hypothetical protein
MKKNILIIYVFLLALVACKNNDSFKRKDLAMENSQAASEEGSLETRGSSSKEHTLFDAVLLTAPSTKEKSIYIFSDKEFNKSCLVTYQIKGGKLQFKKQIFSDGNEANKQRFKEAKVLLVTWYSPVPLCSDSLIVSTNGANDLILAARGPLGQLAHHVVFTQTSIITEESSREVMAQIFCGTSDYFLPGCKEAFRSIAGYEAVLLGLKLNQYVTFRFEEFYIKNYSAINFTLDATAEHIGVNTDCVDHDPTHRYAQKCYDSQKHGNQFRMALGNIVWKDSSCSKRDESDPICKYFGDFLYITMQLHDERREFFSVDEEFFLDPGTQSWIYRVNMRDFLPKGTTKNPFKIQGKRTTLKGDLGKLIKTAILKALEKGYLPPRLKPDGVNEETDTQYLAHYVMSTTNLGYEVSGLSHLKYRIHKFKLTGTSK